MGTQTPYFLFLPHSRYTQLPDIQFYGTCHHCQVDLYILISTMRYTRTALIFDARMHTGKAYIIQTRTLKGAGPCSTYCTHLLFQPARTAVALKELVITPNLEACRTATCMNWLISHICCAHNFQELSGYWRRHYSCEIHGSRQDRGTVSLD